MRLAEILRRGAFVLRGGHEMMGGMIGELGGGRLLLRRYRREDLEAIFRMDEVCFPEPFRFDLASMRRFAEAPGSLVLLAEREGGTLAGFVIVHVERRVASRRGYVVTLDVAPAERRAGVAGALMTEAEGLAQRAGAEVMELHVHTGNEGAIRFYEARGYERVRLIESFYGAEGGGALDAFLYRKALRIL